ncbi:MAG: hypothetical protein WDO12_04765 [Pseudomonadota bacterium]
MATSGNGWATVSWSASSGATSYAIKRASTSGGSYSQIATAASSSYTDSTVTNGTTYFYVVAAINSVGASPDSTQVSATPQAATTAPMAPTGLAATAGNAQVALTWTASTGASSYLVKRSTTSGTGYAQLGTTASTSYTDTTASNGTTYFYVVDAVNSAGSSSDSAQASATPVATTTKSIVITPTTAVVSYGGVFQFTAAISNSPGSTVVWSVQESSGAGTIASDGRYTAPMAAGTFHVVAKSSTDATLTATATVTVTAPQGTFPTLTPGVWKDITPPAAGLSATYGADYLKVSPVDPNVIYVAIDTLGIWRTTDRGSNWTRLGTQTTYDFGTKTTYIDSPIRVEVDPGDANHLVVTQGVRGQTLGFWVSRDGGQNWVMPQAFHDNIPNATNDVTTMVVDPTNFNHILLGSHSPWGSNQRTAGIMETKDGGTSWILHEAPQGWPSGSLALGFLYDPATGQGNSDTWIVGTDGGGFWRTTNAGASWTKVSSFAVVHHGGMFTYAKDGTLYSGGQPYPVRSHDNGVTWEQVSNGLLSSTYYTVVGDGTTLYTQIANTGGNGGSPQPYMSAPEAGGGPWASYQGGAQTFTDGPFTMGYDAANGIMYSANWKAGIWALKVIKP